MKYPICFKITDFKVFVFKKLKKYRLENTQIEKCVDIYLKIIKFPIFFMCLVLFLCILSFLSVVAQRLKFEESYDRFFPVAKPIQQKRPMLSEEGSNSVEKRRRKIV